MLIAFLTADLVFPSRVGPLAQRLDARLKTFGGAEALIEAAGSQLDGQVIVLLDLNSPQVDPTAVVPRLKSAANPPRAIIAFGPHVHAAKLAAAQSAGCDIVLTRGQFDAQMEPLLSRFAGRH